MTKKRLILTGLAALLITGGLGAGAWWFLSDHGQETLQKAGITKIPGPGYIKFDPFVVPVLRSGQVTHHVTMFMRLQIKSEKYVEPAVALMPRLMDSILMEMHGLYNMRYVVDQGFDNPLVRERIKVASERVLGQGMVTGLELQVADRRKPPNA